MFQADGFALGKCLSSSRRSQVFAAVREADGLEVVIKSADAAFLAGSAAAHEFDALHALRGEGIVQALELLPGETRSALVLERLPGIPLEDWVRGSTPSIDRLLDVAIGLTAGLERIHATHWLHCAIHPRNAMVDPESLRTHWIDFALARPLGASCRAGDGTHWRHGLHYIAPEQTGRMNRGIDARSDLYALGAVLYFATTGATLFDLEDPLALTHAQIARVPPTARERRRDLPGAVSRLIGKLLQKEPEERYQSARALLADLRACREQLRQRGAIDPELVLGSAEAPDRPRFSSKLYGRDGEIDLLRRTYGLAADGVAQLLVLAGEPGSGKSALVAELRPQIARTAGYMAVGKFDLSRVRPCAAWAAALGSLVQQILTERDERLALWRERLREGLGNIAQAMVDLVPDLGFVLGSVAPLPRLGSRETQARTALAVRRFIHVCATQEHPLLIFLDDLQWSDAASRELLEDIAAHETRAHLLIIGAYRANEVDADHPLTRCFENIARRDTPVQIISLQSLSCEATVAMLGEVLERPLDEVRGLAERIERKTGNAPLFVRQFVEHLHAQDLLRYRAGAGWGWEDAAVDAAAIPDGAIALVAAKIDRLPPAPRAAIELASCVGDPFDVDGLCEVSSLAREMLEEGLYALADLGLISPGDSGFRFIHDRIREAACDLVSAERKERIHYEIAWRLLERIPPQERPLRTFEIAEHLNESLALLTEEQRLPTVRIELDAARLALAVGAPTTAARFLEAGRRLLREKDWSVDPTLAFDLLFASMDSATLCSRFDTAFALADDLERRDLSMLQIAQLAAKRAHLMALTGTPEESAPYIREQLARFGVRIPARPSRLRVALSLLWLKWRMRGERAHRALRPTAALDARRIAALLLVGASASVFSRTSHRSLGLSVCWALRSNLRHGAVGGATYTLGGIALFLQDVLGDTPEAERLERIAMEHLERVPDPLWAPKSQFSAYVGIRPWRMERRKALAPVSALVETLHELGDVEYACYARFLLLVYGALAGNPVSRTRAELEELGETVRRSGHRYAHPEICSRPFRLLEAMEPSHRLEREIEETDRDLELERERSAPHARTVWLMLLCVYGRWDLAVQQGERTGDRLFDVAPMVHVADHCFYRGLAAAALCATSARPPARERRALRQNLRRLERWARFGPDFLHMADLLRAERARIRGADQGARALYERAAQRARRQDFPHHAALAHERLAQLLTDLRRPIEAQTALARALALYEEWGAISKCNALRATHPALPRH
jgi:hypothetical protein